MCGPDPPKLTNLCFFSMLLLQLRSVPWLPRLLQQLLIYLPQLGGVQWRYTQQAITRLQQRGVLAGEAKADWARVQLMWQQLHPK